MRIIKFPAQNSMEACNIELPYSPEHKEYSIFWTPFGYRYAEGVGNVLTGIDGEVKVLEIALEGQSAYQIINSTVNNVTVSDAPLEEVLADLAEKKKAEIANARYQSEIGGIEYNGAQIHTDRESQAKIQAAAMVALTRLTQSSLPTEVQSLVALLPASLDWKGKNEWLEADDETIIQLAFLVFNHVQQCYQRERQLQEQIEQATTVEGLEVIVWDEQI